ncbi:MAG: hypothetical protein IPK76_07260 [Lewinellaceae bacterium]|nr:hypothetical protein [Lewinellaceae bacterium]
MALVLRGVSFNIKLGETLAIVCTGSKNDHHQPAQPFYEIQKGADSVSTISIIDDGDVFRPAPPYCGGIAGRFSVFRKLETSPCAILH